MLRHQNTFKVASLLGLACAVITAAVLYLPSAFPLPALAISATVFGMIVGMFIRSLPLVSRKTFFTIWGIAAITYFGLEMVLEVFFYQPWHQLSLAGHLVYLFALRAVYNSPLVILYSLISLGGALIPVLVSRHVWKNFQVLQQRRHERRP